MGQWWAGHRIEPAAVAAPASPWQIARVGRGAVAIAIVCGSAVFVACAVEEGLDSERDPASARGSDAEAPAEDGEAASGDAAAEGGVREGPCPPEMAHINAFCIDRWEAHVVAVDDAGVESPHSPYETLDGRVVRAKSAPDVVPQGYISQIEAAAACARAGKRLCAPAEFSLACSGVSREAALDGGPIYPYGGRTRRPGACNEGKGSAVARFFGNDPTKWTYANFNDPILNQWDGGLARTGAHAGCRSVHGVYDCVGNLHEWGDDEADALGRGRFRGGFYGDAERNGKGCLYVTSAHELSYHDYSTGFRCCRDADEP